MTVTESGASRLTLLRLSVLLSRCTLGRGGPGH